MNTKVVIEKVVQPQLRLPVVNIFSQYFPEKSLMADIACSALGKGMLFLINTDTLAEEKFFLPEGANCGMRAFTKGIDNKLYFGSGDGALYSFDVDRKVFNKVAVMSEENLCCVGIYASSSGKLYVGLYPKGEFFQCDPVTGEAKRFSVIPHENMGCYCSGFIDLPDGRLLVNVTGGKPGIAVFDPVIEKDEIVYRGNPEREIRGFFNGFLDDERILVNLYDCVRIFNWRKLIFEGDMITSDLNDHIFLLEKADDAYYFSGPLTRKMYKLSATGIEVVKVDFPLFNVVNNFHYLGDNEFICLGDNGLVMRFNLKTKKMLTHQIDNITDSGMGIQFLAKIPGEDVVIGAHFINSQMYTINLKKKTSEASFHKVVPTPGQLNCGTTLNGKFYIGSYVDALISEYDWHKPFIHGENPHVIGRVGEEQNRPIGMVNDGRYVFIATGAGYGKLGGAITVLDPATDNMEAYRNFIEDQNPTCLFYHAKHLLVGATSISGDCGTGNKPTAENAVVFLWDTEKRKTVYSCAPWKIPALNIMDMSPAGVCLGTNKAPGNEGEEYFLWNVNTKDYEIKKWPLKGVFIGGIFMNDREFYGATEHGLFVLDITSNDFEMLTKTTKMTGSYITDGFTKINDREFLFDNEGVNVMKATINI